MGGFLKEFREFAVKGNVIDLAVGVVIGAAFGKIVTSLVNDLIMPIVGALNEKGGNFSNYKFVIKPATETTKETALLYGSFAQSVLDFIIVAFAIFLMVKLINRLKRIHKAQEEQKAAAPATPPADVVLLTEIRDLLKQQR